MFTVQWTIDTKCLEVKYRCTVTHMILCSYITYIVLYSCSVTTVDDALYGTAPCGTVVFCSSDSTDCYTTAPSSLNITWSNHPIPSFNHFQHSFHNSAISSCCHYFLLTPPVYHPLPPPHLYCVAQHCNACTVSVTHWMNTNASCSNSTFVMSTCHFKSP